MTFTMPHLVNMNRGALFSNLRSFLLFESDSGDVCMVMDSVDCLDVDDSALSQIAFGMENIYLEDLSLT